MLLRTAIGTAIHERRLDQGRTLRNLASKSYISLGYLSEVEKGKKDISSELLENVANGLFMSTAELMIDVTSILNKEFDILNRESNIELAKI